MKAGFFSVAAVALLQLVAAQPHGEYRAFANSDFNSQEIH